MMKLLGFVRIALLVDLTQLLFEGQLSQGNHCVNIIFSL